MDKVAIIGTGLIGTSLGLAIKQSAIKKVEIVGTDRDRSRAHKAQSMGALDHTTGSLPNAVEDAEIVIIATPVMVMKDLMEIIASHLSEGCLVTDTGGSKGEVIEWAERYLPRSVNFVGGHPIVSKGASGPEAADANLFQGRPYCVIPSSRARQDAVRLLTDMVRSIGAKPYYVGVEEHDSLISAVSHLPLLLSVALVGCTSKSASWDDIAQVASTQYGDQTQLAGNDPVASRDVFAGNNESTVAWIDSFIRELYEMRQILTGEEESKAEALEKVFSQALEARNRWRAGVVGPEFRAADRMPSASVSMAELFTGSSEARRRAFGWGAGRDKDPKRKK